MNSSKRYVSLNKIMRYYLRITTKGFQDPCHLMRQMLLKAKTHIFNVVVEVIMDEVEGEEVHMCKMEQIIMNKEIFEVAVVVEAAIEAEVVDVVVAEDVEGANLDPKTMSSNKKNKKIKILVIDVARLNIRGELVAPPNI